MKRKEPGVTGAQRRSADQRSDAGRARAPI